ncbi:MAG: hypothetical protein ACREF4_18085, partial [Gammaproteobacteria bacterium]
MTTRPSFRDVLARLDRDGGLLRLAKEVDARHLSALVVKAEQPVLFERVRGFDVKVAGGLFWNRKRFAAALGWPESELATRFAAGARAMVEPELVEAAPAQEIVRTGG